jgi:hypothetical protein
MYLWAGFYKTGSSNIEEALFRLGWGNYRSTSAKCGYFQAFRKMKGDDLFVAMSANNYLIVVDNNYSIIANQTKEINTFERELTLARNFKGEEFLKIYYENNSDIHAYATGKRGLLEQFVYESADSRMCYEVARYEYDDSLDEESLFKINSPFENVCETIEDITLKVFGKKHYAEFGSFGDIELENFILV